MGKARKCSPEQIVTLLRQIEVGIANGKTHPVACREVGITEQTYYRWRKEYGSLKEHCGYSNRLKAGTSSTAFTNSCLGISQRLRTISPDLKCPRISQVET